MLPRDRLVWVSQNYLRDDTLVAANAKLVAAQNGLALARSWGGGEVASADGIRFVVPVKTVHAGPTEGESGTDRPALGRFAASSRFSQTWKSVACQQHAHVADE